MGRKKEKGTGVEKNQKKKSNHRLKRVDCRGETGGLQTADAGSESAPYFDR
jgi:hypothetical protein